MSYCIYCGAELAEGNKFCGSCGKAVFEFSANKKLKTDTEIIRESQLESDSVVEQPTKKEEYETASVETHDNESKNDRDTKEKGGISVFAIILCSIAAVLVILLVVMLVVRNSKPKYRIVNKAQTIQTVQKTSVEKKDTQSKNNDLAKKNETITTSEELVYSIADDGYVNIRYFPDADSDVVGVLATNCDGAKLISNQGTWWKVRIGDVEGYVNSEYVKLSDTPVKISGLPAVYYVVLESHSSLDSAQTYNYRCPDGMECWIYKCTLNGKTVYRVCDGCFSTLQKAQAAINDWRSGLHGHLYTDAWIWKNVGLGNCVYCPPIYEGDGGNFPPLTPTGNSKQAIMWGE